MVSCKHTLIKTLIWRIIATVITFVIVFLTTNDITKSAIAGSLDTVIKTFAYFVYERLWVKHQKIVRLEDQQSNDSNSELV